NGVITSRDEAFDSNVRLEAIGRHYLAIRATQETGLGPYSLSGAIVGSFTLQRDVPLVFQDYTNQTTHMDQAVSGPFTRPDVVPNLIGNFESRYDIYD